MQNMLPETITDPDRIASFIPQREPIVMVDSFLAFAPDKVVAGLTIRTENIFVSNLPDQQSTRQSSYKLTEAGLIEHMAQTVALHTGYQYFLKNQPAPVGYIGSIKNALIMDLPNVGDNLTTTAQILHEIMGVTLVEVAVVRNGEPIARAQMKTVIAPD